jgi:hypothetical protein
MTDDRFAADGGGEATRDWFDYWDATQREFNEVFSRNPSIRGMVSGYLAEEKLKTMYFEGDDRINNLHSPDDHDRDMKADWIFDYRGHEIFCEVKSLQSNHVDQEDTLDGGTHWTGKFQCDASDKREVTLPDGRNFETTCLVQDEFDVLAINLFEFGGEWKWAFARNQELPRTPYSGYDEDIRQYLIKGTMDIEWPLREDSPYYDNPWDVLENEIDLR